MLFYVFYLSAETFSTPGKNNAREIKNVRHTLRIWVAKSFFSFSVGIVKTNMLLPITFVELELYINIFIQTFQKGFKF